MTAPVETEQAKANDPNHTCSSPLACRPIGTCIEGCAAPTMGAAGSGQPSALHEQPQVN